MKLVIIITLLTISVATCLSLIIYTLVSYFSYREVYSSKDEINIFNFFEYIFNETNGDNQTILIAVKLIFASAISIIILSSLLFFM